MKMTVGEAIDAVMARIENGEIGGDDVDEAMGEVMACIGEGEFSAGDQIEAVIERRRIDLKLKVEEIYALWLVNTICGQGLVRLSQHIAHAAPPRGYTSRLPETGEEAFCGLSGLPRSTPVAECLRTVKERAKHDPALRATLRGLGCPVDYLEPQAWCLRTGKPLSGLLLRPGAASTPGAGQIPTALGLQTGAPGEILYPRNSKGDSRAKTGPCWAKGRYMLRHAPDPTPS